MKIIIVFVKSRRDPGQNAYSEAKGKEYFKKQEARIHAACLKIRNFCVPNNIVASDMHNTQYI